MSNFLVSSLKLSKEINNKLNEEKKKIKHEFKWRKKKDF